MKIEFIKEIEIAKKGQSEVMLEMKGPNQSNEASSIGQMVQMTEYQGLEDEVVDLDPQAKSVTNFKVK